MLLRSMTMPTWLGDDEHEHDDGVDGDADDHDENDEDGDDV